jgi:hypothetical protein
MVPYVCWAQKVAHLYAWLTSVTTHALWFSPTLLAETCSGRGAAI